MALFPTVQPHRLGQKVKIGLNGEGGFAYPFKFNYFLQAIKMSQNRYVQSASPSGEV